MDIKYTAFTKQPKPYLKRIFKLDYFGGFCGYHRKVIEHELPQNAAQINFSADEKQEYVYESTIIDGNYFNCYIEHYDKHNKLNHTEQLTPIKVENVDTPISS